VVPDKDSIQYVCCVISTPLSSIVDLKDFGTCSCASACMDGGGKTFVTITILTIFSHSSIDLHQYLFQDNEIGMGIYSMHHLLSSQTQ
jgi:hypothetical protein